MTARVRALRPFYDRRAERPRDEGEEFETNSIYADFLEKTRMVERIGPVTVTASAGSPPSDKMVRRGRTKFVPEG